MKMSRLPQPDLSKSTSVYTNELFYAASSCMRGWRAQMQDKHSVFLESPSDKNCAYFAVYDGHGGARAAEFACQNLHDYIMSQREYREGDIERAIHEGYMRLDLDMSHNEDIKKENAGSTVCTLLFKGGYLYSGNAGDSRALAFVDGNPIQLSRDHKPTERDEMARIFSAGSFVSHNRLHGQLAVSRGFGNFKFKGNFSLPPDQQAFTCSPYISQWKINNTWKFVLVATDGIFGKMSTETVCHFIDEQLKVFKKPQEILEELFEKCCAKVSHQSRGRDNMTAILVLFIKNFPLEYRLRTIFELEPSEKETRPDNPQPGTSKNT